MTQRLFSQVSLTAYTFPDRPTSTEQLQSCCMARSNVLSNLAIILQDCIKPDDCEWSYSVPNLPSSSKLQSQNMIKSISVVSDTAKQNITLRFNKATANRATSADPLDTFISISFADFRLQCPRDEGSTKADGESPLITPATAKESADYVTRLLQRGVTINGVTYNFYGHSNSQLKSRACFLHAASKEVIARKVENLGDFSKMKSVAKKAKRIGLLFSAAETACELLPEFCEDIPDVATKDYNFTDGCGLISERFAKMLVQRIDIRFRNKRYTPSVFQIRYRGYKGVLVTDPTMKSKTKVKFREDSMRKFKGGEDLSFSVIECAKPYVFGSLNDEVVLLLHSLGISEAVLHRKQQEYFEFLSASVNNPSAAFRFLTYNNMELAERVLLDGIEPLQDQLSKLVKQEFSKLLNKKGVEKCRIMIPKSRLLFGVCDSTGVLKEGECAVKVTMDGDGEPVALKGMEILVTRNPCLHPGDLQKFHVVEKPELSHLRDCIVFPIRGKRPSADMMSGGDLDGDKFFVCWDPDLVPSKLSQPARYQGAKEPITLKPITDDDRLQYFARYTNASLGRVKNLYLDWARTKGPMSGECQELNHLFSMSVDGNRIRVPKHLENAPEASDDPFILDTLHEAAAKYVAAYQSQSQQWDGFTFDAMQLLLSRENFALTEFELVKLTHRWCLRNDARLTDFLEYFDFNQLSDQEKAWVLSQLPKSAETPGLVLNSLLSSNLVDGSEIHPYMLDSPRLHWKCAFDSSQDRMATFLESATRLLEDFHKKLLVLRTDSDERFTFAIYVPKKIQKGRDCQVDDKVRLFAFPHSQQGQESHRCVVPTKRTYRLYCDEHAFQLYQGQRGNTWVHIKRPGSDNATYQNAQNIGDRRRLRQATLDSGINHDFVTSVALDKFSRGLKTHIGRVRGNAVMAAEIYVISNRDVRSLRTLDLWLSAIDTEETMPLFDNQAREYVLPTTSTVDWASEPDYLSKIVRNRDFSAFHTFDSLDRFDSVFQWLWQRQESMLLREIFHFLLALACAEVPEMRVSSPKLVSTMISFTVVTAVPLAATFTTVEGWANSESPLHEVMMDGAPKLLLALISAAQEAQELVVKPFASILRQVPYMSLPTFAELVRVISLTVRSPDVALDLLLASLEPESARLLSAPAEVVHHFVKNMIGLALDHIDEAKDVRSSEDGLLDLKRNGKDRVVSARLRIDAHLSRPLQLLDHVRLTSGTSAKNSIHQRLYSMDAIVKSVDQGNIMFECLHPLPSYIEDCSWKLTNCGSFVTTQTMIDSLCRFALEPDAYCSIQDQLLGLPMNNADEPIAPADLDVSKYSLNESQNAALRASMIGSLTLLWGPPGTGKSHTIVAILQELLASGTNRILVAAPTHNAVDNVMRKYISTANNQTSPVQPIRVSTDIRKVAEDMRPFTCDAMMGKELAEDFKAQRVARKRIQEARLVFTTCIGAALGLLRNEKFNTVIIDEASQQTEAMSLVPLVKGCTKAILVGDHVQLRATVQPLAQLQDVDVSLFERLYHHQGSNIQKVMLDSQYRMHRDICSFSSEAFYDGRLRTAVPDESRILPESQFPWPASQGKGAAQRSRLVFVQCSSAEDIGRKSKGNMGQAELCHSICSQLLTAPTSSHSPPSSSSSSAGKSPTYTIAVLTPYTRQVDMLRAKLSSTITVSSIDGFQGREADIVVFVTVRCNVHGEIGFLNDLRRLNVVMTRAKVGCVVVGDRGTLRGRVEEEGEEGESRKVWRKLMMRLDEVLVVN